MAYDSFLAERVRKKLSENRTAFEEKKMFGGVCFMVNDKMCTGVINNDLMIRIDPEKQKNYLTETGCRLMDFTHRPMKGFLYVSPEGVDMDEDLDKWVKRCLEFNPMAKSSKKRK